MTNPRFEDAFIDRLIEESPGGFARYEEVLERLCESVKDNALRMQPPAVACIALVSLTRGALIGCLASGTIDRETYTHILKFANDLSTLAGSFVSKDH